MTEAEFQDQVVDLARQMGWRVSHFGAARVTSGRGWKTPVRYDSGGFPDLTLVHPDRQLVLFREIKGVKTPLTPAQVRWGEWLIAAGADWAVWRPADWHTAVAVLTGGRALLPTKGT